MKNKQFIVFALITIVIVTLNATSTFAEDLNQLALDMNKEIEFDNSKRNDSSYVEKYHRDREAQFAVLHERFDKLSIDEKHRVTKLSRDMTSREILSREMNYYETLVMSVADRASEMAVEDGFFLGDQTEEEIRRYLKAAEGELTDEERAIYIETIEKQMDLPDKQDIEVLPEEGGEVLPGTSFRDNQPGGSNCPYYPYNYEARTVNSDHWVGNWY